VKRLVIAGDGTWNGILGKRPSNVEKLARTIELDPQRSGVPQVVHYVAGVGTAGDRWDRLLGGAIGAGVATNLLACYRFLCTNFRPGDEVYLVGFSRGAYMVRSLASLVSRVGILTSDATVSEQLPRAMHLYLRGARDRSNEAEFKRDHSQDSPIRFLGVFDTVGEVGWSGLSPRVGSFHDMSLHSSVQTARQALAIDERRMKFSPWVWTAEPQQAESSDVRQVWFEGDHSDVGGGNRFSGLSDVTLLWMASEASRCGLVFDWALLAEYVDSRESQVLHSNMNPMWWTGNLWRSALGRRRADALFEGRRRRLTPPGAVGVRVAESTIRRFRDQEYRSQGLEAIASAGANSLDAMMEPLFSPVRAKAVLIEELRAWASQ
jgi:hypothetical protein